MKMLLLAATLLIACRNFAQCPSTVGLTGSNDCPGATLTVRTADILTKIVWYKDGLPVETVLSGTGYSPSGIVVAGGNGPGTDPGQLTFPQQIFVDPAGNLYVTDENNNRIQKFTPGSLDGVTVAGGNGSGPALNQFNYPIGMTLDGAGNIYVSDYSNERIQKWAPGATSGVTVAGGNGNGPAANQLDFPVGMALDGAGNLYIADIYNNRVQKWAQGGSTGVTVAGGNGAGAAPNQLNNPSDVFVDAAGNLYIADDENHRIQKWAPGAASGVTVAGGNGQGSAPDQLNYPYGVYVDGSGNIFVADAVNNRIQEWGPGATAGVTVAGGNGLGSAANQLNNPRFVWLDAQGNIFVSDDAGDIVREFTRQTGIDDTYTAAAPGVYSAVVTDAAGCVVTTSSITIVPSVTATVSITASANPVCSGTPVAFTATAQVAGVGQNGGSGAAQQAGTGAVYQWQVNGIDTGANSPVYTSSPAEGDQITCMFSNPAVCSTIAVSDTVTMNVVPLPVVGPEQVVAVPGGQAVELDPNVSGDIAHYLWSPATGLSDDTIRNPIARPLRTIVYTLKVVSTAGCIASGTITVKPYTAIRLPGAFSPNGDGRNDVFYVLGGAPGSVIRDFSVFDRWGQRVFAVHDVAPGDPAFGWNGMIKGQPAATGAYVYALTIVSAADGEQVYRGVVMLVR